MIMTIGEVRDDMARELGLSLESVVNSHKHLRQYYILIHVLWEGEHVIRTKLVCLLEKDKPKLPLFNTMLYLIDNANETFNREWCLPMDPEIPEEGLVLLEGKIVEDVLRSSAKLQNAIERRTKGLH